MHMRDWHVPALRVVTHLRHNAHFRYEQQSHASTYLHQHMPGPSDPGLLRRDSPLLAFCLGSAALLRMHVHYSTSDSRDRRVWNLSGCFTVIGIRTWMG